MTDPHPAQPPRVVIIGGGFAGLFAARALASAPIRLTVIDQRNHHLFQPLLYQVATAALSPAMIASPIRKVLARQANTTVLLAQAQHVDPDRRVLVLSDGELPYDVLVIATGATHSYFGHDEWAGRAPGLKTVEDALEIRRRFLLAFEAAEREPDARRRRALLTFLVIGAGPTGVEMAGAIAEIARGVLKRDFRTIDTASARVILVEAQDRVLPAGFPPELSERARRDLLAMGVEVRTGQRVTAVESPPATGVFIGEERIEAENVIWAAGVKASPLGAGLGAPLDTSGRVRVAPDLSVPGRPDIFVVGDLASVDDPHTGKPVPGVAPAAMQMGRHVGRIVAAEARARARGLAPPPRSPFRYHDKGTLATIGRARAVGVVSGFKVAGFVAWALWALVHVMSLIGFRNRLLVMLEWAWAYLVYERGARLITGDPQPTPAAPHTHRLETDITAR